MRLSSIHLKITFVFLIIILSSCSPALSPAPTFIPPTSTEISQDSFISSIQSLDVFNGISIINHDKFSTQNSSTDWNLYTGTIRSGVLNVYGNNWNGLFRKNSIQEGIGTTIDFTYTPNAHFEIFLNHNEWGTEDFKRFGVYIENNKLITNVFVGSEGYGGEILSGTINLKSNTLYSMLLAPLPNSGFIISVWNPNDPSENITYQTNYGNDWSNLDWTFGIGANKGTIEFDNYREFTYVSINNPVITGTPIPQSVSIGNKNGVLSYLDRSHINLINLDSSGLSYINKSVGRVWIYASPSYAWSPNGRNMAFISNVIDKLPILNILDTYTSEVVEVPLDPDTDTAYSWLPEGNKLIVHAGNDPDFWIIDLKGNRVGEIYADMEIQYFQVENLSWFPEGDKFSFNFFVDNEGEIKYSGAVVDIEGNVLAILDDQLVMTHQENTIGYYDIHSFEIYDLSTNENIEIINVEDKFKQVGFYGIGLGIEDLTVSPDGRYLAYQIKEASPLNDDPLPDSSIHVFDLESGQDYQITNIQKEYNEIIWSPLGDKLVYTFCDDNNCILNQVDIFKDNELVPNGTTIEYELCVQSDFARDCTPQKVDLFGHDFIEVATIPSPDIGSLYWVPSPILLHPSIVTTPPTPWNPLPNPPLYDSFEGESLNLKLWSMDDAESLNYFTYELNNGYLKIESVAEVENQSFGLRPIDSRDINSAQVLEASLKIDQSNSGNFAFVKTGMDVSNGSLSWATQCRLGNRLQAPSFVCDVANTNDGYNVEYQTRNVPINFDQWYIVRIELQIETGAVQYYLDGNLIDTYLPSAVDIITDKNSSYYPVIGAVVINGNLLSYIDDVKITE